MYVHPQLTVGPRFNVSADHISNYPGVVLKFDLNILRRDLQSNRISALASWVVQIHQDSLTGSKNFADTSDLSGLVPKYVEIQIPDVLFSLFFNFFAHDLTVHFIEDRNSFQPCVNIVVVHPLFGSSCYRVVVLEDPKSHLHLENRMFNFSWVITDIDRVTSDLQLCEVFFGSLQVPAEVPDESLEGGPWGEVPGPIAVFIIAIWHEIVGFEGILLLFQEYGLKVVVGSWKFEENLKLGTLVYVVD